MKTPPQRHDGVNCGTSSSPAPPKSSYAHTINKMTSLMTMTPASAAYFRYQRLVQQRKREMQDAWMVRNTEEIQNYAECNKMKNFFKAIDGHCIKGAAPMLSSDGTTLLTEKSQILKRWAEHLRSVLNCSSAISNAAIDRPPQVDMKDDLGLPPYLPETIRAVQQISSGKATGSDAIPPEVYKHCGPRLSAELTTLFQMWRQG
ncbi:unnamed protein product [Schistocephalus solidus]|uniref:Uncharacterized protein n=1 Tax=Schistocephalus solidus TaxID=70667 RepID=A0A183TNC1_SCHSO|nr:unnamed protein product [Schistocephalus solidus]